VGNEAVDMSNTMSASVQSSMLMDRAPVGSL